MQQPLQQMTETALGTPAGVERPAARPTPPWRRLSLPSWLDQVLSNRKAALGVAILAFFVLVALVGPFIWPGNPSLPNYSSPPMSPPSAAHWFGTDQQSHDVFLQMIDGTRPTLIVGFSVAILATLLSLVGMIGGYAGGWVDELVTLVTNIFLVIPAFPLIIVLASWIQVKNDAPIILVIALTSWAFGARVLRSQTLTLRRRDYVEAAIVSGESSWRIIFFEILPNMTSLVVSGLIGLVVVGVGSAAGLQFLGLGNLAEVNWFTILYWAQQASALQQGAWWTFVIPGGAIALVGVACALINYGIDEISNPRLRLAKGTAAPRRSTSAPSMAPAQEAAVS
jgi:peptide/nickel transport system permease protein